VQVSLITEETVGIVHFQTTDSTVQNGIPLYDQILMSGFPHTLSTEELQEALPEKQKEAIEKVIYTVQSLLLIEIFDQIE